MQNWEPLNANETHTHHQQVRANLILCWQVIMNFGLSRFFFWKLIGKLFKLESYRFDTCKTENLSTQTRSRRITYHELQSNLILLTSDYEFWTFTIFWEIDLKIVQTRELHTDSIHKYMQNWEPLNANEKHTHHHQVQSNLILCWQVIYENFTSILHKYSFSRSVMM